MQSRFAFGLLCALAAAVGLIGADRSGADLKSLLDAHDWFKLRRLAARQDAGDFYKGQVACAFHDVRGAERYLGRVIASTDSKLALDARGQLAYMYLRTGEYRKTYKHLSAMQRLNPETAGLRSALALFSALSPYPELAVGRRRASKLQMTEDFFVPASVNGRLAQYGFDTGGNLSIMSQAEATRLGLRVHEASGSEHQDGASGTVLPIRFAIADRLALGGFELRNVVFTIMPENALPFRELPPDKQGILGISVIVALGSIAWDSGRVLRIGYPPAPRQSPNLCFEAAIPIAEAFYDDESMSAWLDTGSERTYLTPRFLRDFRHAVENSAKQKVTLRGVGGETEVEALEIPKVTFSIGGSELTLNPAKVLAEQQRVDRNAYHVWLGMNLLSNRRVTIDFRSMTIRVGP